MLLYEAIKRAIERGKNLRAIGYIINAAVLSPLPRAVATAIYMLEGYGDANMPLSLEPRLGDLKTDPRIDKNAVKALKEMAKERYGDDGDANLAKCLVDSPAMHDLMFTRAEEGAQALTEIAANNVGKTVLATSHGVARMEIVLRYLNGFRGTELLNIIGELIERGGVVELTFETVDGVTSFVSAKPLTLLSE